MRQYASIRMVRATIICALALLAVQANADILFTYNGFANTAGLTLVGNAGTAVTSDGTVLRVTPASFGQSGAAYSTVPVPLGPGDTFSTQFDFRITGAGGIDPADGFTFVVAASPSGLGAAGGGLGYSGASVHSIAVEFDTFNNGSGDGNSSNHVALDTAGVLTDTGLTNVYGLQTCDFGTSNKRPGCMSNGDLWTGKVSYNGTALSVVLNDPAKGYTFTALNNLPVDIASILGTNQAFVGFTSGTGDGFENHDITFWTLSNSARITTPEPASLALFLAGVVTAAPFVLRRRTLIKGSNSLSLRP